MKHKVKVDEACPSSSPVPEIDPAIERRMREALLEKWLDTPVPKLGGRSPREAARDPAMREAFDEMFKAFEYIAEQKRRDGEPYFDVADVRRNGPPEAVSTIRSMASGASPRSA